MNQVYLFSNCSQVLTIVMMNQLYQRVNSCTVMMNQRMLKGSDFYNSSIIFLYIFLYEFLLVNFTN